MLGGTRATAEWGKSGYLFLPSSSQGRKPTHCEDMEMVVIITGCQVLVGSPVVPLWASYNELSCMDRQLFAALSECTCNCVCYCPVALIARIYASTDRLV